MRATALYCILALRTSPFFKEQVPRFFFFIGGRPNDVPAKMAIPNHSPFFYVDESALPLEVHAMSRLAVEYHRAGANHTPSAGLD